MMYRSHAIMGASAGAMISGYMHLPVEKVVVCTIIGLIGSFIPDIDHGKSYISQRIPLAPWLIQMAFSHRGFTHSALFLVILYLGISNLGSYTPPIWVVQAFLAGILSHMFGDMLTGGVRFLWPIPINIKFLSVKTNGSLEVPVAIMTSLSGLACAFGYFYVLSDLCLSIFNFIKGFIL